MSDHTARHVVDLAHEITDGMITYPGIPAPALGSHLTFDESHDHYAPGTEFTIGMITIATNTGTYLDTHSTATARATTWRRCRSTGWPTSTAWSCG